MTRFRIACVLVFSILGAFGASGQTCGPQPPSSCSRSKYRTMDGSCNNLQRPLLGVPQTPYGRLTEYTYSDGVCALPRSRSGKVLPNPRSLSLRLFPDRHQLDPVWTLITQQWGQIITHDMSLTAGVTQTIRNPVQCCTAGKLGADALTNVRCAPILVPKEDIVHRQSGTQCLNFVRAVNTVNRNCTRSKNTTAAAEPITMVTGYMDLSLVYGSNASQAESLRTKTGGKLRSATRHGRKYPPQQPNVTLTCESARSPDEPCYLAGDSRVNQSPQLALLQIILFREHNRLADALAKINPHWSDETLYQEARRINIAQIQHINYYEYLPILLGKERMAEYKLIYPGAKGYINDYDPNVDPSVLDEHATAAFRHFHTLIRGHLNLVNEKRTSSCALRLSDWFNRPAVLEEDDSFDKLSRGLATQLMDRSDQFFTSEITQFLFKRNATFGNDLRATDIQRARDHGLGTYVQARRVCRLPVPTCWDELTDISRENVEILRTFYESVEDVDLVVGGSLEDITPGTQAGPTFLCILTEQFYRTRTGDRYFYENGADAEIAFTIEQLREIRKATMARILCDNSDNVKLMQPRAFEIVHKKNKLVACHSLPVVDLSQWREDDAEADKVDGEADEADAKADEVGAKADEVDAKAD